MVKICNIAYDVSNNQSIQEHFDQFPFPLSDLDRYCKTQFMNR